MYCGFNPSKSSIKNFTYVIGKPLDSYIGNYDNFLVDSDFNSEINKLQSMPFVVFTIFVIYVIQLLAVKIQRIDHALIFF